VLAISALGDNCCKQFSVADGRLQPVSGRSRVSNFSGANSRTRPEADFLLTQLGPAIVDRFVEKKYTDLFFLYYFAESKMHSITKLVRLNT